MGNRALDSGVSTGKAWGLLAGYCSYSLVSPSGQARVVKFATVVGELEKPGQLNLFRNSLLHDCENRFDNLCGTLTRVTEHSKMALYPTAWVELI